MSGVALAVAALAMAVALLRGPGSPAGPEVALLVVAFAALAAMVAAELREPRLDRRLVLAVGGALLVLAVIVPPMQSNDVWSYATYGRMVSEYQVSPYRHAPADFPGDPVAARSSDFWRDSPVGLRARLHRPFGGRDGDGRHVEAEVEAVLPGPRRGRRAGVARPRRPPAEGRRWRSPSSP